MPLRQETKIASGFCFIWAIFAFAAFVSDLIPLPIHREGAYLIWNADIAHLTCLPCETIVDISLFATHNQRLYIALRIISEPAGYALFEPSTNRPHNRAIVPCFPGHVEPLSQTGAVHLWRSNNRAPRSGINGATKNYFYAIKVSPEACPTASSKGHF